MNLIRYYNPRKNNFWPFESLFERTLSNLTGVEPLLCGASRGARDRSVGYEEKEDAHVVKIELPGYSKKEVKVEIDKALLLVTVCRKDGEEGESDTKFQQTIHLPDGINPGKSKASLTNGVLTVDLPKSAARKPLPIKVG